jgi:F-type H+-transporting ATPase subunit gamma
MASLKEIKIRIQSVRSTQKITSAMKMVSSAKLRKAQKQIENFYPYEQKLTSILNNFLNNEETETTSFSDEREIKKVAIVVFSSNSSFCGSFNSNVTKKLTQTVAQYKNLGKENIFIIPIGKKIAKNTLKLGFSVEENLDSLADKPNYKEAQKLSDKLMTLFIEKEIDKVELIYHHFISKGSQQLLQETLLPIKFSSIHNENEKKSTHYNYIIEPDKNAIIEELVPKVIRLKFYTALLDSSASEHAARTIAMQIATENADELLETLKQQYNKSRQQAITNELLDIIGGSFGN